MGFIFAVLFGAAVVIIFMVAVVIAVFQLIGIFLGFLFQAVMTILTIIAVIIGIIMVWKLVNKGSKEAPYIINKYKDFVKKRKLYAERRKTIKKANRS